MKQFVLHPQLANDCHQLGRIDNNHLLLHNNASVRWLIIVPVTSAASLQDLPVDEYVDLMMLVRSMAEYLEQHFECDKVNVASIGNLVPQLHLHVIARHHNDPCWPSVVWGNLKTPERYDAEQIQSIKDQLTLRFSQFAARD